MKSTEEIQEMLISELQHYSDIINNEVELAFYNEALGDTSFLLSGLLYALLKKEKYHDWLDRWIDDTLLMTVKMHDDNKLSIGGVLIWGKLKTTEQWTDPFYFEASLNLTNDSLEQYFFLFGDLEQPEVTYDDFNPHRDFWNKNLTDRNWKYTIRIDNALHE